MLRVVGRYKLREPQVEFTIMGSLIRDSFGNRHIEAKI